AMGRALLAGFLIALTFIASAQPDASAQFAGRVAGVVVNGTSGAQVPPGFEVVLLTTDLDGNVLGQVSTKVDERSVFEFNNVLEGDDVRNRLVTDYQGVISTTRLEDEVAPANLKLQIFETTRSLDPIEVVAQVMVARPDGASRLMGVLEFVTVRNASDRTFIADLTDPAVTGMKLLRFGLPPNFEGLTGVSVDPPLPQGQLVEVGPGFALTNPIPPGEYRILFEYFVRYEGEAFEFSRNMPFGASEYRVLLVKDGGTVSGDGLQSLNEVTLGQSVYKVFRGGDYPRDARITTRFSDLPQPSFWQTVRNGIRDSGPFVTYGVPIAAGAVMAALLAYVIWRRGRRGGDAETAPIDGRAPDSGDRVATEGPEPPGHERPDRQALVRDIALLDECFEAGEIEDAEYRRRRDELTRRALEGSEDR
ncbi:MAG: hypothetical protein HY682_07100, partial [Chloroflexi bacterium]|nr:hypothetical protein [Chloroflexota bacterium]